MTLSAIGRILNFNTKSTKAKNKFGILQFKTFHPISDKAPQIREQMSLRTNLSYEKLILGWFWAAGPVHERKVWG